METRKWQINNKEKAKIYDMRYKTKKFITEYATKEELQHLQQIINQRMSELH